MQQQELTLLGSIQQSQECGASEHIRAPVNPLTQAKAQPGHTKALGLQEQLGSVPGRAFPAHSPLLSVPTKPKPLSAKGFFASSEGKRDHR